MTTKRYAFRDRDTQSLAENVAEAQRKQDGLQLADGVTLSGLAFTAATAKTINHGLGYRPRGFVVMRALAAWPGLYCTQAQWDARTDRQLAVTATATGTADVRVF